MTHPPKSTKKGVCRRALLRSVPAIAGAIIVTNAMPERVFAQTKLTHEAAKYQDEPKDGQQCSDCAYFEPPASCTVVEDPISPTAWCQLFVVKPA